MKIFAIMGKKQSGKSTFAKFVAEILPESSVQELSFATPVKRFCVDYMGIPEKCCFGNDFEKNMYVGTWSDFFDECVQKAFNAQPDDPISGRQVMQALGTNVVRNCCRESFWQDLLIRNILELRHNGFSGVICVPDVRFPNEYRALKDIGAKSVRIYRYGKDGDGHASETAMDIIPDTELDYVIYEEENKTLKRLRKAVMQILNQEELLTGGLGI